MLGKLCGRDGILLLASSSLGSRAIFDPHLYPNLEVGRSDASGVQAPSCSMQSVGHVRWDAHQQTSWQVARLKAIPCKGSSWFPCDLEGGVINLLEAGWLCVRCRRLWGLDWRWLGCLAANEAGVKAAPATCAAGLVFLFTITLR